MVSRGWTAAYNTVCLGHPLLDCLTCDHSDWTRYALVALAKQLMVAVWWLFITGRAYHSDYVVIIVPWFEVSVVT